MCRVDQFIEGNNMRERYPWLSISAVVLSVTFGLQSTTVLLVMLELG